MLGPWSILIDIQHQRYVRILACSDCYQCSTVVPRPRNEPLQESAALCVLQGVTNTVCPTRYRTRHFFNNCNIDEDIATKFEQECVCCVRNEEECVCSPLQISLQYPH